MKRSTLIKHVGTLAILMFTFGVMAQNPPSPYVRYDSNVTYPDTTDYVTFKTGGTTMGYYALPDSVYHPTYVGSGTLTLGFIWNWTNPTHPGTAATFNKPGAANYVEITYPVAGAYVINVAEQAPAGFGSCADTIPTVMNVSVIAPPTFTISAPALASTCGDQAAQIITVAIVENVPANWAAYAFQVTEEIDEIDINDAVINNGTETVIHNYTTASKLKTLGGTSPNFTWSFNTAPLTVNNGHRTRYVYRFKKAADAPGAAAHGVISAITQKSDYSLPGIANLNTYPCASGNAQVVINSGVA